MKIDRKILITAVIFLYLLVIRFAVAPNWRAAAKIRKETVTLKKELDDIVALNARYRSLRNDLETALRRDGPSGFLSEIQKKAEGLGFSSKLKTVTPFTRELNNQFRLEGFDIRLEGVDLKETVLFTEALQEQKGFYLDRLVLEKSRDGMSLSARLRLLTIGES